MSKNYLPYDPDQQLLLPQALQEWLPEGHLAYFVSDAVDQLDLSEITARSEQEQRGGPPYNPRMMVKALLYAYCIGAPRRLHDASPAGSTRTSPFGCWRRITRRTSAPSWTFARIAWRRCRGCFYRRCCCADKLIW